MKKTLLLLVPILFAPTAFAQDAELDADRRAAIVAEISQALREVYVFPDVAEEMSGLLGRRLEEGAYDGIDGLPAYVEQLTEDLQSVSHDLHLRVRPIRPGDLNQDPSVDDAARERFMERMRRRNYGFERVERLAGNVGYLDLRQFAPAELAGETAIAALRFLAHSDALIVDLRRNGGGSPSMIQLISSYLFEEPVHLNSFYIRREDRTQQFWTQAHVEGEKMVDTPVWVLTSRRTFSAAEEFTYNLKNMERATIVGETTGGGAHPVDMHRFPELGVEMSLPFGRAVNPITGTNWEGTGVEPDVAVPEADALTTAHRAALAALLEDCDDPGLRGELEWVSERLDAELDPVVLDAADLAGYVGDYGPRKVRLADGALTYQRDEGPIYHLVPMGRDRFLVDGLEFFRVGFERDASKEVVTLLGIYDNGRTEPSPRTGG